MTPTDTELDQLTHAELVEEVLRLREGIHAHRDSTGHNLCWHHPDLWNLLPEQTDPLPEVPEWPQFLSGCVQYPRVPRHPTPERAENRSRVRR